MRVVVVGATGNAGTSVLRALDAAPEVTSVLGIARRMPDRDVEPYSGCEWAAIDIAAASSEEDALDALRTAFAGADAVIHLAWLIQPNSRRRLLRRVNVDGTARVARAAADAGVAHLVVASSVGAYSPDAAQAVRTEDWPVLGVATSHYSVDKAAQERVLDEFSAEHPEVLVTRMRPALTFQADAGYEIQRYFVAAGAPTRLLTHMRPPVMPIPKGFRGVQAVHSDDVGRAYAATVVRRAPGAFNICADDILDATRLAEIVDHGRVIELPQGFVRAVLAAAHRLKLVAADAGWLDMGLSVPMMDNAKAKAELGWTPQHSAADALESLLRGMAEGRGTGSVPLRAREPAEDQLPGTQGTVNATADEAAGERSEAAGGRAAGAADDAAAPSSDTVPARIDSGLLGIYLSDHLTGSTAGSERIERMAAAYIDTPVYARLSELAQEIRSERAFLRRLIRDLGLRPRRHRQAVAWIGERIGRLKGNGRVVSQSPLTLVLEAELMRSAVIGKLGLWQSLEANAAGIELDPGVFAELADASRRQADVLGEVHEYARERAFLADREA